MALNQNYDIDSDKVSNSTTIDSFPTKFNYSYGSQNGDKYKSEAGLALEFAILFRISFSYLYFLLLLSFSHLTYRSLCRLYAKYEI